METNKPFRSSILGILHSFIKNSFLFVVAIIGQSAIRNETGQLAFIIIMISLVLIFGITLCKWYKTTYSLEKTELIIRSGIFVKEKVSIPYAHIHAINTTSSLLQRIFSLVNLDLDTAAKTEAKTSTIKNLSLKNARQISTFIESKRDNSPVEILPDMPINPLTSKKVSYVLSGKRLWGAAVTKANLAFIFLLIPFLNSLTDFLEFFEIRTPEIDATTTAVLFSMQFIVLLIFFAVLLSFIASVLYNALRFAQFSIDKSSERMQVKRGLLSQSCNNISIARIQGIQLKQGIIARLLGYVSVHCLVVGNAGSADKIKDTEQGIILLHPFIALTELEDFFKEFLPEYSAMGTAQMQHLPQAGKARLQRRCIYVLAVAAGIFAGSYALLHAFLLNTNKLVYSYPTAALLICLFAILILRVASSYAIRIKNSGFFLNNEYLILNNSGWDSTTTMFSRKALQYTSLRQTIFQLHANLYNFACDSACKVSKIKLAELSEQQAKLMYFWVLNTSGKKPSNAEDATIKKW